MGSNDSPGPRPSYESSVENERLNKVLKTRE